MPTLPLLLLCVVTQMPPSVSTPAPTPPPSAPRDTLTLDVGTLLTGMPFTGLTLERVFLPQLSAFFEGDAGPRSYTDPGHSGFASQVLVGVRYFPFGHAPSGFLLEGYGALALSSYRDGGAYLERFAAGAGARLGYQAIIARHLVLVGALGAGVTQQENHSSGSSPSDEQTLSIVPSLRLGIGYAF